MNKILLKGKVMMVALVSTMLKNIGYVRKVRYIGYLVGAGMMLSGFSGFSGGNELNGQTLAALQGEKARLMQEIEKYERDLAIEQQAFMRYKADRERLLADKQDELVRAGKEVRGREVEIALMRRELRSIEGERTGAARRRAVLLEGLRERLVAWNKQVVEGIPFAVAERQGVIRAILNDSRDEQASVGEIFSRMVLFLKSEQALAYDSQVIRTVVELGGEQVAVDLLRLGRVYFAVDTGRAVYEYRRNDVGRYYLATEEELTLGEENSVRNMVAMLQGRLPADLVALRLPGVAVKRR